MALFEKGRHDDPAQVRQVKMQFYRTIILIALGTLCFFALIFAGGLFLYSSHKPEQTIAQHSVSSESTDAKKNLSSSESLSSSNNLTAENNTSEQSLSDKDPSKDSQRTASSDKDSTNPSTSDTTSSSSETENSSLKSVTEEATSSDETTELSLMMVGDDLYHMPVTLSGKKTNGTYNYDSIYKDIRKDARKSDLAMINQEVLSAGESYGISSYPRFNTHVEVTDALAKAGFHVILHATNHSMDKGSAGLFADLQNWKQRHPDLQVTGTYATQRASKKITYFTKNDITIAILNYTYGTNGLPLPSDKPWCVNLLTKKKVARDVRKAKEKADFIIVCPHWGTEYYTGISAYQQEWTDYFLKQGVNLVIGAHPHVIGPVKWVKDNDGHRMLVYYSLGNFVNSYSARKTGAAKQYYGGMAKITLEKNTQETSIKKATFVPLITHWDNDGSFTTYKTSHYNATLAARNRLRYYDPTFSITNMNAFFQSVVGKKFLVK